MTEVEATHRWDDADMASVGSRKAGSGKRIGLSPFWASSALAGSPSFSTSTHSVVRPGIFWRATSISADDRQGAPVRGRDEQTGLAPKWSGSR